MGIKRKVLGIRNGIKIYKKLVAKTGLKAKKPMRIISQKQKVKNQNWRKITDEVCIKNDYTCFWCGLKGTRDFDDLNRLEGHHIIPRRYNIHTKGNCYPSHNLTCHDFITDHSIDVKIYPTKEDWEKRDVNK